MHNDVFKMCAMIEEHGYKFVTCHAEFPRFYCLPGFQEIY